MLFYTYVQMYRHTYVRICTYVCGYSSNSLWKIANKKPPHYIELHTYIRTYVTWTSWTSTAGSTAIVNTYALPSFLSLYKEWKLMLTTYVHALLHWCMLLAVGALVTPACHVWLYSWSPGRSPHHPLPHRCPLRPPPQVSRPPCEKYAARQCHPPSPRRGWPPRE